MQATIASTDAERIPFWSALITDRRIGPALGLGFTSGMPFLLIYSTQSAWLTDAGVPLATIGLLSELTLAYKFKFVWAPFLDQYGPPLIGRALGRRRGWLIVAILAIMAMLAGVAFGDPGHWIWWTVGFSLALGIAGATLDLVLDGVLHLDLAHRHPGRAAGGLRMVPCRDIGRGADRGQWGALERFERSGHKRRPFLRWRMPYPGRRL
jgi:MFS family permease